MIPFLIVVSISYIRFLGEYLPGVFRTASLPLDDVLFRTIYNDEGLFGILANISSSNIALFMIFGGFLVVSGASDFVIEVSKVVAGRIRGGRLRRSLIICADRNHQWLSVNTASTGVITIPLMKSSGFRGRFGCGIEAAASTGGQLMPPIMGGRLQDGKLRRFLRALAISVIPAFLYFLSVRLQFSRRSSIGWRGDRYVDQSGKNCFRCADIRDSTRSDLSLMTGGRCHLRIRSHRAFSLRLPGSRGLSVALSIPMICNQRTLRRVCQACLFGIRGGILTATTLTGVINNAIVASGIGNGFSLMIAQWSQGSLVIAILLIGLASLVLGMVSR